MKRFFQINSLPYYLAGLLLLAAFIPAFVTTSELVEPPEIDFYRDMGSAEILQRGDVFSDPNVLGEYRWYNPLTPGIVGAIQKVTGIRFPTLYARIGTYLNLLSPLMFFVMVSLLLGRWTAVPALAGYLFLGLQHDPSWYTATYSPWLWPCNFAQSWAYATVSLYVLARQRGHWGWEVATGIVLGLTFLSHSAPAVILAAYFTLATACHVIWPDQRSRLHEVRQFFLIGFTSFVVSLPFLAPIVFVYRMHLENTQAPEFLPYGFGDLLLHYATIKSLVAVIGFIAVVLTLFRNRNERTDFARASKLRLLLLLTITTFGFLTYAVVAQELIKGGRMFPLFHYGIYCKAVESVLFGAGIVWLCNDICRRSRQDGLPSEQLSRKTPLTLEERMGNRYALVVVVLLMTGVALPGYCRNKDRTFYYDEAVQNAERTNRIQLYQWVRQETQINDVFVCDRDIAVFAVGAAGRKVICADGSFTNPFVKFEPREKDTHDIYVALRKTAPAYETFDRLAKKYGLKFVVAHDSRRAEGNYLSKKRVEFLTKDSSRFRVVFHSGDIRVLKVRLPKE